jgi:hypothetical protein
MKGKNRVKRRPTGAIYADFGFSLEEVFECAFCKTSEKDALEIDGFSLMRHPVPITPQTPIAGLIGVCLVCLESLKQFDYHGRSHYLAPVIFEGAAYPTDALRLRPLQWTPPPMSQPVQGVPMHHLLRDFSDEHRLGELIRQTWERIPKSAREAMVKLWRKPSSEGPSLITGALRIESLPNWPERSKKCLGQCLNGGRAVRLHSPTVNAMTDAAVMTLIAHELGHCYQWAISVRRSIDLEDHVIKLLSEWGFDNSDIDKDYDRLVWERMARRVEGLARQVERLARRVERLARRMERLETRCTSAERRRGRPGPSKGCSSTACTSA